NFVDADLVAAKTSFSASRPARQTPTLFPYTTLFRSSDNATGLLGNYTVTYNTALFTINKRLASVSAVANSKTYGDVDPALTTTNSNFVAADLGAAKISFSDRKSTRLNSSHVENSYAVSCLNNKTGLLGNYTVTYN